MEYVYVLLNTDSFFFIGQKVSLQLKQTEEFALRAHQTLVEVAKSQKTPSRCPECHHCKESAALPEDLLAMLSPSSCTSATTPINHDFMNLVNTAQESEVSQRNIQESLYSNDLNLGEMDIDSSFLDTNSFSIMLSDSCNPDFNPAIKSTKLLDQAVSTSTNNDAPLTPLSSQDFCDDFNQEIADADTRSSSVGYEDLHTNNDSPASTRTYTKGLNQKDTAIHLAAREGYSSIITILLQSGADVNARDEKGRTPLHHCAESGHVDALKVLLASGADSSAVDEEGTSILLTAVKSRKDKVVASLVEVMGCQ
jgi:hypothetical protein